MKSELFIRLIFAKVFLLSMLLLLGPFYSIELQAQKVDSLQNILSKSNDREKVLILNEIAEFYLSSSPEESLKNAKKALELSKSIKFSEGEIISLENIINTYNLIINVYNYFNNYIIVLSYIENLIEIYEKLGYQSEIAKCYNDIGQIFSKWANYNVSIEYSKKALKIFEKLGKSYKIAETQDIIGAEMIKKERYVSALKYFKKSLEIYRTLSDSTHLVENLNYLAKIYIYDNDHKKAKELLDEALEICRTNGDENGLAMSLYSNGKIFASQKKYHKAIEFFDMSLHNYIALKNTKQIANIYNSIAEMYLGLNENLWAISEYEKSLIIANMLNDGVLIMNIYESFAEVYSLIGDYKQALYYHQLYSQKREYITKEFSLKQIAELEARYKSAKNEKQIEKLQKEQQIKSKQIYRDAIQLKKQKALITVGIVSLIITAFFVILLYQKNRLKKNKNRELELKNEKISEQKNKLELQSEMLISKNIELEKLSIVASEIHNSVIIANNNGEIEWVNNAFEQLYGQTLAEFKKTKGTNLVDAILNEKIVESCIKNKESGHFTSYFASVSGKNYWLKREITPIFDKNDNLRKIVALDSDVTLFKMAEEEIKNQHLEMENQRDIALIQKDKIMSQNIGITDSIKYAQKIQSALLPSENSVARYFKEYFIINKPRDIVSGDFYWISYKEDKIITVVADCTGHGVPGAFMSILGIASLEDLVNNSTFISAENLLFKLRENVISSLNTTSNEVESKDGMDMALCIFDLKNMILDFAGAYNPLYLIRDGNLKVYKADRMPIGVHPHDKKLFTSKKILIEKGDRFYMFSDGYIDQFGWRNGKKFKTKQFKELIVTNSNLPMKAQRIIIENTLENWKGDFEQVDDILIMGLKV